jgi:alpha-L-fucosidase 2
MKFFYCLSFILVIGLLPVKSQDLTDGEFHRENNLIWGQMDNNFYNGAFIGDGVQGAMIMQDDEDPDAIRMLMGHYQAIAHQTISGWEYANSRVYAGSIILNPVGTASKQSMMLDIFNGKAEGDIVTNEGTIAWSAISDRKNLVFAVKIETTGNEANATVGVREEWGISPRFYLDNKDPYTYEDQLPPKPTTQEVGGIDLIVNKMRLRGAHVVASTLVEVSPTTKLLYVAVGVSDNANVDQAAILAEDDAVSRINAALAEGYETMSARHIQWWNEYMNKGTFSVKEDPFWQKFWWLQIYKFACASSETSSYLIDTQGPWIWETAWAGVWWNLNIQLSYFPVFSSNRLDAGKSLINGMNRLYQSGALSANAGNNGIYIGRSSTYEGKATWGDELGNLPWILHNYYKYWKYSGDDAIGHALFPMLKDNMKYLSTKMTKGGDGKYHVSASRSPEYDDQLLYEDANYALMSIDWVLRALLEMNDVLNKNDSESAAWQEKLDNLTPLPANSNGYMIAPSQGFDKGHRHYSHLLSIYPYHTILPEDDPTNLIGRSIDRWLTLTEAGGNAGYTYTAGCAMRAIQGNGDEALRLLEKLRTDKLHPNTMYSEGGGPVIETPFSGVESINYLVLQSFGGVIKVFPAVPSKWKNVRFNNFRAEGAFLVSASLKDGEFASFEIVSEKGNVCKIRNPWIGKLIRVLDESSQEVTFTKDGNDFSFETISGAKYIIEQIEEPRVIGAKVQDSALEVMVEFSDELSIDGAITGFSLKDGEGDPIVISSIEWPSEGKVLTFVLQSAISNSTELYLSYVDGNVTSVYDLSPVNFTGLRVDNLLPGSPPVLTSAYVEGNMVSLNFNKDLSEVTTNPFLLKVLPDTELSVEQVAWVNEFPAQIELVLSNDVYRDQVVELNYNGTPSVSSPDGGNLQPFSGFLLENRGVGAPPVVVAATAQINGIDVKIDFDKEMSEVAQEILFFELKADGVVVPVSKVEVAGKSVILSVSKLLQSSHELTFSYLDGGNVVATDGGKLDYFTDIPVTNDVVTKYITEFNVNNSYPNYEIDIAEKDKVVYNDRNFIFPVLPDSVNKVEFIRWSNNMKSHNEDILATLKTNADGRVFIAHDNRIQKPDWLKNKYKATAIQFYVNDALMTLYYKEVKSQTLIELGPNQIPGTETGSSTQYVVFFRKGSVSTSLLKNEADFIRIFPNPSNDFVTISTGDLSPMSVEVYSVSGNLHFRKTEHVGDCHIPVLNWTSGVYVAKMVVDGQVFSKKLVVSH